MAQLTAQSPRNRKLRRFGFSGLCFLVGLAIFSVQQGCSMLAVQPSWLAGLFWFVSVVVLLILGIWLWDPAAKTHFSLKMSGSLIVVMSIAGVSYVPIKKQYQAEHTSKVSRFNPRADATHQGQPPLQEYNNRTSASITVPEKRSTPASEKRDPAIPLKAPPTTPEQMLPAKGPRLALGPDEYKDLTDEQVAQWISEEADKVSELTDKYESRMKGGDQSLYRAEAFFFSNDFRSCCEQGLKDLRAEALRRLGPPGRDVREERAWTLLFPEAKYPMPQNLPRDLSPHWTKEYIDEFRRFGQKLKRRGTPRLQPQPLNHSEALVTPRSSQFPFDFVVSITAASRLSRGYVVVEFEGQVGSIASDFQGSKLVAGDLDAIENRDLRRYLTNKGFNVYTLQIGENALTPDKPIHVFALRSGEVHISKVTWFDE